MSRITLRPVMDADCVALAETMRAADRAEVLASGGGTPLEALRDSVDASSHAVVALDGDGRVICMFGVGAIGFMSDIGSPWMLASDLLDNYWRLFVRLSRKYLASVLEHYPTLENWIDARQVRSIRWLRWLGFTVAAPRPHGPMGAPFCAFAIGDSSLLTVEACSIGDLEAAPNIGAMLEEYAAEGSIAGMPKAWPKWASYRALEAAGLLHTMRATINGDLAGFVTVLAADMPRYSVTIATGESFFVAKAHRKSGAGLRLLRMAEDKAAALGSPGLLISAPFGGTLFKILPRLGYSETNRVFFKEVSRA